MLRVGQYKIGTTLGGIQSLCDVLYEHKDPQGEYQEYAEVVAPDLTGAPIEAGFPRATWRWNRLSQTDFNKLVTYMGTVYIRTRNNVGGGATTYGVYSAVMARPKGTFDSGEWVGVSVDFTMLVLIP